MKVGGFFQNFGVGGVSPTPAQPMPVPAQATPEPLDAVQLGLTSPSRFLATADGRKIGLPEQGRFLIGRSDKAQVKLQGDLISRQHAEAEYRNGTLWLRDLSQNGTFINGKAVPEHKWVEVPNGAQLGFGQPVSNLRLGGEPGQGGDEAGPDDLRGANGQLFRWPDGMETIKVGRADGSHMQLADGLISNNHALLRRREGKLMVLDTQSRNGTFLDGERIPSMTWTEVPAGANLGFGDPEQSWTGGAPP